MYIFKGASRIRQREAHNARNNRAEIVKARSLEHVTRRELFRMGIFTSGGLLALKNGLSPFAPSAFAAGPTGTPRSPLFGAAKFTQPMPRLSLQTPVALTPTTTGTAAFPNASPEIDAKRMSYHTDFSANPSDVRFRNPLTNRGPIEGRPPGPFFAHQRWKDFFPKAAYVMSMGQIRPNSRLHPNFPAQNPNSVWSWGAGRFARGSLPPPLIKGRYGEPILARLYNNLPVNRAENGGFGRNEISTHFHNAHNGGESDGASNGFHFPGTFFDYLWSTSLARRDRINKLATDPRATGPSDSGGLVHVPGDFRELQGSMWFHDHRFFFTAENVYKGNVGVINYYSGPDRGNEELNDGVNLRLPSGSLLGWGNIDFDLNLVVSDAALDPDGQLFFDIFDTDGFVGDVINVNSVYAPYFEVLPRKYRLRIVAATVGRFFKFVLADEQGSKVPFQFIANDGNLVVNPITLNELDEQGSGERYDIVVDFSRFRVGGKVHLVNLLQQTNGRRPDKALTLTDALRGASPDPGVGRVMEFRVVSQVESVDVPGVFHSAADADRSVVPATLTEPIPIVAPVRERIIEFKRGGGELKRSDQCVPDCGDAEAFPWTVKVNGQSAHSFNANRIALLIPKPGEVEHWTVANGGGGWDHPVHLHFEEGVTIDRGGAPIPATEKFQRKDVWRLRPSGRVKFQVQFSEFGGAYVQHCHNTAHEDFAMLHRVQVLNNETGEPQAAITPTPHPTADGVTFTTPEIYPEGDPRSLKTSSRGT